MDYCYHYIVFLFIIIKINICLAGGSMSPIWHSYFGRVRKVMYVIDAVNLTQLGEATLLLMDLLSHPRMRASQVCHTAQAW